MHGPQGRERRPKVHSSSLCLSKQLTWATDGLGLIIMSLMCANIRNYYLPSSRVRAPSLDVFLALSSHLTDEAQLDRMVLHSRPPAR